MDNNGKKNNNHDVRTETEGSLLNHPTVNVTFKTSKTDENDYRCGISTWRPLCIQVFAKFHVALAGLVVATLCVTLNFASMTTSVSNWEKRYSLPSKVVGLAFTLTDVAQLVALLLVGYIGGRRNSHTPRWIGGGMVLAGIGLYIVSCLQFMSEPYQYGTIHSDNSTSVLCSAGNDVEYSVNDTGDGCNDGAISGDQFKVLLLIFAGLTMFGIGISPIFILGVTYIDDNVVKNRAPFYLGMMFAMYAIGPLIGFPLSAAYSNLYVDFYRVDTSMVGITPYDPRWVGAWWLPFIINGTLCIMIGIPFMLLPKRFHAKIGGEDTYKQGVDESKNAAPVRKQKMKDLPQALKRLICNKTYLALMFVRTSDMALMAAFAPFCVKYISDQFRVTMSIAGIIVPFAFVIPSGLAIFVGGTLMRKYKPKLKTTARNIVIAAALTAPLSVMLIFIGCSNYRFTGINTEYAVGFYGNDSNVNNVTSCNAECICQDDVFDPVCGSDGITYPSPCHAGCQSFNSPMSHVKNFTECICTSTTISAMSSKISFVFPSNHSLMASNSSDTVTHNYVMDNNPAYFPSEDDLSILGYAKTGICREACTHSVIVFVIVFFIFTFIGFLPATFSLELVLRCVDPIDKPFALGVQNMVTQLLAWIPTPVFVGAIIDSSCILWETKACGDDGACWIYDLPQYRMKYMLVILAIKIIGLFFKVLTWWTLKDHVDGDIKYDNVPTNKPKNETVF